MAYIRHWVFGLGFHAFFVQALPRDLLNYFKNYFVTGDYAVGGVGLSGKASGFGDRNDQLLSVPCTSGPGLFASVQPCTATGALPADVIAAFLYWQTIETTATPSYASGAFDATAANPNPFISVALGNANASACAAGGGTQSGAYTRVYRADVLRYLPIKASANVGWPMARTRFSLRAAHPVLNSSAPSLVVVYRLVTPEIRASRPFDPSFFTTGIQRNAPGP